MDLLKPLLGAERTVDTVVHCHKPSEATGRPRAAEFDGIAADFSWNFFLPMAIQSGTQVQPAAHMQEGFECKKCSGFKTAKIRGNDANNTKNRENALKAVEKP